MPSKLPENLKSLVIQQWLKGEQRDKIAFDNGLSAGAVTNTVAEWRQQLGFSAADELRDLAVGLKKIGITSAQCAVGFRVAMMMNRLGVKEDSYELFMTDIYSRCNNLGLRPESISYYLTNLLEFSNSVPFSKIPDYIDQKTREKKKLEEEIERLKEQKEDFEGQKSVAEELQDIAMKDEKMAAVKLKWYSDLKEELRKYGIPVDDISQLAKVVNGISKYGYDIQKVIGEFSSLQLLKIQFKSYKENIANLKQQYDTLNKDFSFLQQLVHSHNQSISIYNELEAMGFGLKELKVLWHTVREIVSANNLESQEAMQKFFKDIDEHYDDKLGFESKINELQAQVNRLSQEEARLRTQLLILPLVAPSLTRLIQRGVSEQDIVDISELLKNDGGGSSSSDSSGVTIQEIRSLITELRSYGSIKSTISQLSERVDKLKNQLASLRIETQNLHMQNQRMFSTLLYSKQMVSFFSGSSVSLKNEIVGLISVIAYMMYLLDVESKGLQKLQDSIGSHPDSEFIPLTMAARGEVVDLQKLKIALVKAIEATLQKLNSNSKLNEILSKGRLALLGEQL